LYGVFLMKVAFSGDRNWTDVESVRKRMTLLPLDTEIICGDARGLDTIVYNIAKEIGFKINGPHYANWRLYGRSAGPIRNRVMLDCGPDLLVAYHPDLESSKGTKDCVNEARRRGIAVEVHNV